MSAFDGTEPKPGCVGGRVEPLWQVPKPDWFPPSLLGYLSVLDLGDEARWCDIPREHLVGCNIAFRKDVLQELGGFDTQLGRKGKSLKGNEEIDLLRRMKQRGLGVFYVPSALVHHIIPKERLAKKWLIRRLYAEGLSDGALSAYDRGEGTRRDWGRFWTGAKAVRANLRKAVAAEDSVQRTLFQTQAAYSMGSAAYSLQCALRQTLSREDVIDESVS
jgi:hypothetical protein